MSKSLIIIPRSPFLNSDRVMPTLGPLYLKSFLESHGHSISIEDTPDNADLDNLDSFDVIGISTTTPQYHLGGNSIAKELREKYPSKKLIIGGAHAKYYFEELGKENLFDHIIRGDGQKPFLNILENKNVPAIINSPNLTEEEINSYPTPWRDKEYLSKYKYTVNGKKSTTAMTGLRCPMGCKFCEERNSGLTLISPEKIEEDLIALKNASFEGLMFYDDIFTLNEKRMNSICKVIKPHNLIFRCNGHAKLLSRKPETLNTLIDAGCVEICVGIESGDQRILDAVGKGTKITDIYQSTENILNCGLKISAYVMIGLPGESEATISNTEKYISRFSNNPGFGFDLTIFYPYKHTYIRENINKFDLNMHLEDSPGYYKGINGNSDCHVSTSSLSREDIINQRNRLTRTYQEAFRGTVK